MARKRRGSRASRSRDHRTRQIDRRLTALTVTIPVPVTHQVRTVHYTYPLQLQRQRRVIRTVLRTLPIRYTMRKVTILVPQHLPHLAASYVSLRPGQRNIHSHRQTAALLSTEQNRRRYVERKTKRRKARNGQLESPGSTRLGLVAEAVRRGLPPETIADAALVARGIR